MAPDWNIDWSFEEKARKFYILSYPKCIILTLTQGQVNRGRWGLSYRVDIDYMITREFIRQKLEKVFVVYERR